MPWSAHRRTHRRFPRAEAEMFLRLFAAKKPGQILTPPRRLSAWQGARFHQCSPGMSSKIGVGLIGCGKISDAYFAGLKAYDFVEVIACADLDPARATA